MPNLIDVSSSQKAARAIWWIGIALAFATSLLILDVMRETIADHCKSDDHEREFVLYTAVCVAVGLAGVFLRARMEHARWWVVTVVYVFGAATVAGALVLSIGMVAYEGWWGCDNYAIASGLT